MNYSLNIYIFKHTNKAVERLMNKSHKLAFWPQLAIKMVCGDGKVRYFTLFKWNEVTVNK